MKRSRELSAEEGEKLIDSEYFEGNETKNCCACLGFFFSVSSGVVYTLTSVLAKMLPQIHPIQISLSRFIGCFVLGGLMCAVKKVNPFPKAERCALIGRSVTGTIGTVIGYYSVQHMAFGDSATISTSTAVFVAILSRIFLREKLPWVTVVAIVISAFGVVLVSQPPFVFRYLGMKSTDSPNEPSGVIAAFIALLMYSLEFICVAMMKSADTAASLFSFGIISVPASVLVLLCVDRFRLPYTVWDAFLYVLMLLLNSLAETLLIVSSKSESASLMALGSSASITVGYLFQVFQFHESVTIVDMSGMALVIISIVIISLQKCYAQ